MKHLKEQKDFTKSFTESIDNLVYKKHVSDNHYLGDDWGNMLEQNNPFEEVNESDENIHVLQALTSDMNKKLIQSLPILETGNFLINYNAKLNEQQFIAVTTTDRPLLVIAGAGTGKTRVITYKVSFLIETGLLPSEILLLTFTRKAANEMLSRVNHLLAGKMSVDVMGGTFHSFANFALRRYGRLIGLPSTFSIIDTEDTRDIIDLLALAAQRYKKVSNLLDYDDLMIVLRDCLKDNTAFSGKLQKSFRYILVDEYQDTNLAQREIVELLAEKTGKLTVVGDVSQSI